MTSRYEVSSKAFTLVELLAVIVILAIIALISVPVILGVVDKSKVGAAQSSAYGYVNAVENQIAINQIKNENLFDLSDNKEYNLTELTTLGVKIKGKIDAATVTINAKGIITSAKFCINNYSIDYDGKKALRNKDVNYCSGETPTTYANGTAVYFNPESGTKCTAGEAVSTTGTKTGCMKWYAFNDGGSSTNTINLILDHNTTSSKTWNSSESNKNGPSTTFLNQLASDTSSWVGVPTRTDSYNFNDGTAAYTINYSTYKARLITASEIAIITGNTGFNEITSDTNAYFFFDTNNQTPPVTPVVTSDYGWLLDYTYSCTEFGCNIADTSNYGYWTSTACRGVNNDDFFAWIVNWGGLHGIYVGTIDTEPGLGIRPVITILKSNL